MLNEPALSEEEVVKFLITLNMITDGWSLERNRERSRFRELQKLLINAWPYYYDIIAASDCTYCGDSFEFIKELAHNASTAPEAALWLAPIHARYLKLANELTTIPDSINAQLAHNFAQLGDSGDSGDSRTRDFIAMQIEGKPALLQQWHPKWNTDNLLSKKSNDWTKKEKRTLITFWENRVLNGTVDVDLSIALASQGHRPALRWIIWLLDEKANYLHKYVHNDIRPKLRNALKRMTSIPQAPTHNWSIYYSYNWKRIEWDKHSQQWQLKN